MARVHCSRLARASQAARRSDTSKKVGDPTPLVFETYKGLWEIFHPDGSAPSSGSFNDYEQAQFNACKQSMGFGDVVLASFTKFSDLGQAGFGSLLGPIADQQGHYVHYLTLYNATEFNFIEGKAFYLRSNIPPAPATPNSPPAIEFPRGSIDVKAAWVDLTGYTEAQRSRYYQRDARVLGQNGVHQVDRGPCRLAHRPKNSHSAAVNMVDIRAS